MNSYMKFVAERFGRSFESYHTLYDWSVTELEQFWQSIWDHSAVIHSKPYNSTLSAPNGAWGASWFEGAQLNFAENLLRVRNDKVAIVGWSEDSQPVRLTYNELHRKVAACASGLRRLGVGKGDRVAAYISNIPEAIVAMLATTSIGAVWSSCSPDFGAKGLADRIGQIEPRVLITVDGYRYGGKWFDSLGSALEVAANTNSIEHVVVVGRGKSENGSDKSGLLTWEQLTIDSDVPLCFEQCEFDHPVYILYSSGTTGVPKCIVHGAGGTLLQHYKELALHTDLKPEDVIAYFTTCGWMMWNWLVSSLMTGATVFLYDGSPAYPNISALWQTVEQEKITIFGTSPKYIAACRNAGIEPGLNHDLSSLRTILSTGAPLPSDSFRWVYKNVSEDLQLSSISGGTDIVSCFLLGCPTLPVWAGEIQCRGLGMKVETVDDQGHIVTNQVGELVCTAPFPSRPVRFWNDPDNKKYHAAYFDFIPNVWRHGDFIQITERGTAIVFGRSDATLNPGGVRIGTAEIYGPVEDIAEIAECIAVGQRYDSDTRIILFIVTNDGKPLTEQLRDKIRQRLRKLATPRHLPAKIIQIKEVPRTLNGKKVELAVTRIIHGQDVPNMDSLANPQCLSQFENLVELK